MDIVWRDLQPENKLLLILSKEHGRLTDSRREQFKNAYCPTALIESGILIDFSLTQSLNASNSIDLIE